MHPAFERNSTTSAIPIYFVTASTWDAVANSLGPAGEVAGSPDYHHAGIYRDGQWQMMSGGEQVVLVCDQEEIDDPDVATLAELHHLSVREGEILRLISQGLSNQEIAERAYLSINTVKSYIRSAYRRMGVESRSQAILWAIDRGFGDAPDPQAPATLDASQRTEIAVPAEGTSRPITG